MTEMIIDDPKHLETMRQLSALLDIRFSNFQSPATVGELAMLTIGVIEFAEALLLIARILEDHPPSEKSLEDAKLALSRINLGYNGVARSMYAVAARHGLAS